MKSRIPKSHAFAMIFYAYAYIPMYYQNLPTDTCYLHQVTNCAPYNLRTFKISVKSCGVMLMSDASFRVVLV